MIYFLIIFFSNLTKKLDIGRKIESKINYDEYQNSDEIICKDNFWIKI